MGNKALLEQRINIRASDYRFGDKKKYYLGYTKAPNVTKEGTKNRELLTLAKKTDDFSEASIVARTELMIQSFVEYLYDNDLLAQSQVKITRDMIKALTKDSEKVEMMASLLTD